MFSNIGEKIKKLSKIVCWIGMIGCVIVGIILLATYEDAFGSAAETAQIISGIVWIVVGPLASWIGSFLLYGFGELISSQKNSEKYLAQLCKELHPNRSTAVQPKKGLNSNKDTTANTVTFGTYPQTKDGADNTPIEWIVLKRDDDKALIISKYVLDTVQYNTEYTGVTWETCSLRNWLNRDFYERAFSAEEKMSIMNKKVTADKNPEYDAFVGRDTADNVFLLSITEVNKYFKDNESRMCAPTGYAAKKGADTKSNYKVDGQACCWWWLRSPGYDGDYAADVRNDGSVSDRGDGVHGRHNGVRPCMWVRL